MLKEKAIPVNEGAQSASDLFLSLTIDRTALSPALIASSSAGFEPSSSARFPFAYTTEKFSAGHPLIAAAAQLQLPESAHAELAELVQALWRLFKEKEAFVLEVRANHASESLEVRGARFGFDDAAFRSSKRQEDVHRLRNVAEEVPEEVEAEKDGIVYVKYASPSHSSGV
jgi:succinyl-CoA synthetase alpha subunit